MYNVYVTNGIEAPLGLSVFNYSIISFSHKLHMVKVNCFQHRDVKGWLRLN